MAVRTLPSSSTGLLDYLDKVADLEHYELAGGLVMTPPAPSGRHQWLSGRVQAALQDAAGPDVAVLAAPYDWVLAPGEVRQPDLVVVPLAQVDAPRLLCPPTLAVEIVSPGGEERDLVVKARLYERAGLEHYWVIRPGQDGEPGELYTHERIGGRLVRNEPVTALTASVTVPFLVTIPLA